MDNLFWNKKRWRPKKDKKVITFSKIESFWPLWIDIDTAQKINLTKEEFEAIKLKNINKYDIVTAGKIMGIGKSTFANLYNSAIEKISEAIILGKVIEF